MLLAAPLSGESPLQHGSISRRQDRNNQTYIMRKPPFLGEEEEMNMFVPWGQTAAGYRRPIAMVALILGLLVPMMYPLQALAYALEGIYPAQWYNLRLNEGGFYNSTEKSAFEAAVSAWNGTATPIYIIYTGSAGAEIYESSSNFGATGWDGQTSWTLTSLHCNGWTQTQYSNVQLNNYYTRNYTSANIQSVSGHELGHAMGLDHVNVTAIMNPNTYVTTPQTDDVNGINAISGHCP